MSKVLLVDTSFSAAPIYNELSAKGHEVHVVGANPNDCLAKLVKNYWNFDYSDVDRLMDLIDQEGYEFLIPGCTDRSYSSCARVSNGRFPGIESVEVELAINNKARFREVAQKIGLRVPNVQHIGNAGLCWPLIVKPVDAFSGKGITIVETEDYERLRLAIEVAQNASLKNEFLIEDFVSGGLFSHSAFLCNRKVIQDFIVREDSTTNQFVVDTSRVLQDPPQDLFKELRRSIEALASELNLSDGLIHTQFIMDQNQIWLIEITRRCPGDLYSQLIELSTGYSYIDSYVAPFLGESIYKRDMPKDFRHIMRHTLTVKYGQNFGGLDFKRSLSIDRWIPLSLIGDQLKPSPYSRIGIIFISAQHENEMNMIYDAALKRDLYEVKI